VASANGGRLLEVDDLHVGFLGDRGALTAVDGIDYTLDRGEVLAVVGESGSGKTVHARALLGILDTPPAVVRGEARLDGINLLGLDEKELRDVRGERISMLFQDPHTALDPVFSVGDQLVELVRSRRGMSRREAKQRAVDLLDEVGIASPRERLSSYPHQLSGGLAQRVMIAMAVALNPDVLIADEPTSSLDVTVQAQVLELLARLMQEREMGMVLITHNLAIAVGFADRIAVMYAGRIVEMGSARDVYERPMHPYTAGILRSIPDLDRRVERLHTISGSPPNLHQVPSGCAFHPRCPFVDDRGRTLVPELREVEPGRLVACHRVGEIEP
jgi:oligopeptide/dipeptide ABC transporter ATP-binding protein